MLKFGLGDHPSPVAGRISIGRVIEKEGKRTAGKGRPIPITKPEYSTVRNGLLQSLNRILREDNPDGNYGAPHAA